MTESTTPAAATVPTTPDDWRALRGDALVAAQLAATWYVHADDTIGGWCIMPIDQPPSCGVPAVASFLGEQVARHTADLHQAKLAGDQVRAEAQERLAPLRAMRELVRDGDIVHVPAGADTICAIPQRILVDRITGYGISGMRIKSSGEPIRSRSGSPDRADGNLSGVADWATVIKSTVHRNGEIIHRPGGTP